MRREAEVKDKAVKPPKSSSAEVAGQTAGRQDAAPAEVQSKKRPKP